MRLLLAVRAVNRASIESWSTTTYRRHGAPHPSALEVLPANEHYGMSDVPSALFVPRQIPSRLRLGFLYELAYYLLAGAAFKAYLRFPIGRDAEWDPSVHLELKSDEGWDDIVEDREFAQLRLQGSNPYLLKKAPDRDVWIADYSGPFRGIHEPVVCEFALREGSLYPTEIRVGADRFQAGDDGWKRAKLIANALDARYTVFGQHLLRTHLVTGQAYALAATALPVNHPLRPFMDVHTYGTLHVNHYSWKLLLTPFSYFIQSNFVDRPSALLLMQNCVRDFRFDELILDEDVRARGLETFPNHPYLEDARPSWNAMRDYCADVVSLYPDDAAVRADAALAVWHAKLISLFPNPTPRLQRLETRDDLVTLMTCLVFNNVVHEVSGDYSTFMTSQDPYLKRLVNFEDVSRADTGPVRLNDVFLFEQGAFSGMFNTAGNNMVDTPLKSVTTDARYLACVKRFREALVKVDATIAERNAKRPYHFKRMQPRQWELSVSF
jgi:hypothetical protein